MAVVEGLAFAYVFEAWRNQTDKDARDLLWFALLSACVFVVVLAPYIAASVTHKTLADVLAWAPALYAWSVCVGLSTIAIVASVGYAQKRKVVKVAAQPTQEKTQAARSSNQTAQAETQAAQDVAQDEILYVQVEPLPAHVCAVCGVGYDKQTSLAAHMRVHANGKPVAIESNHNGKGAP
jgi:membrane glycosyltransferase